jgi:hypothetical protein
METVGAIFFCGTGHTPIRSRTLKHAKVVCILELYLDRFGVNDELTRRRLQQTLIRDLGRLHLVPAHIEEFVKAGIKRARLARRPPEYLDFEPGIDATKSIATQKPAAS